jgi:hypothetical protein
MARYMQTQLSLGIAPDGRRVVSAANLQQTRTPRTPLPSVPGRADLINAGSQGYAMGWEVGTYKGQPLVSHGGSTWGFLSQVAFLPEANVGLVILTNGGAGAATFTYDVQFRLFELLFDQPAEYKAIGEQSREDRARAFTAMRTQLGSVDAAAVAPYQGRYVSPVLGDAVLALRGGRLIFEAGAVHSELRPVKDEAGHTESYVFTDPPLAGFPFSVTLQRGADGRPEVVLTTHGEPGDAAQGDNPELSYVYTRTGDGGVTSPR